MKIIVWGADWCGYCHALMDWLDDSNIEYEEKNGEENPAITGYPTTEIFNDDESKRLALIEGFDRAKILDTIKKINAKGEKNA
jgi:thiol-disulfide isomerase/thioredoxin